MGLRGWVKRLWARLQALLGERTMIKDDMTVVLSSENKQRRIR